MLKKDFRVLRLCAMAGVWIHDQMSIWQVLAEQECVDRNNHDIPVPVSEVESWILLSIAKRSLAGMTLHSRIAASSAEADCLDTVVSRSVVRLFSRSM